jgi:hypothetical protein
VSRRIAVLVVALGLIATGGGCSTPRTASGSLDSGKRRVVQLVTEAARALPPGSHWTPPTEVGAQPCHKTLAGFVVGSTGAHRAQVPLIVYTPAGVTPAALLARLDAAWRAAGYRLDRSRLHEGQYPQLRAHAPGGYDVVATAFTRNPQVDLYSVSQCRRG